MNAYSTQSLSELAPVSRMGFDPYHGGLQNAISPSGSKRELALEAEIERQRRELLELRTFLGAIRNLWRVFAWK